MAESTSSCTPESTNNSKDMKVGRVYSNVWKHFIRMKVEGKNKAKCKYCNNLYLGDPSKGTSHLRKHLNRCRMRKMNDNRQISTTTLNEEKFDATHSKFNQEDCLTSLVNMIIMNGYPLDMVEHIFFRRFIAKLQPDFKMVSSNTIEKVCLNLYKVEKAELMKILENNEGRIAITTDMWTSYSEEKRFIVITAHYIDDDWVLQSRIIRLIYAPCPHMSEGFCEYFIESLNDWNINLKLSTIILDNCSTNNSTMTWILEKLKLDSLLMGGDMLYMRCCAHILNLIVKTSLDTIEESIEKIRSYVAYWTGTSQRLKEFKKTARQLGITADKKIGLDCETRWDSTYLMLSVALEYKEVFSRLKQVDLNLPSELDWRMTKEICDKLEMFYDTINIFFGTKYPTINAYLPVLCEIRDALDKWSCCGIPTIEAMAFEMMKKLDKYWSDISGILGIGVILDPRNKVDCLEFYLDAIYHEKSKIEIQNIVSLLWKLFEEYEGKEPLVGDEGKLLFRRKSLFEDRKKKKMMLYKSELDMYLEEPPLLDTDGFNVLHWWKLNKDMYPILAKMAKDILAIPVSSVELKLIFDTSRRIISDHRICLEEQTIEALACTKNWLRSKPSEHIGVDDFDFDAPDDYDDDDDDEVSVESLDTKDGL